MAQLAPYLQRLQQLAPFVGEFTAWMLCAAAFYFAGCVAWWLFVQITRGRFDQAIRLAWLLSLAASPAIATSAKGIVDRA